MSDLGLNICIYIYIHIYIYIYFFLILCINGNLLILLGIYIEGGIDVINL